RSRAPASHISKPMIGGDERLIRPLTRWRIPTVEIVRAKFLRQKRERHVARRAKRGVRSDDGRPAVAVVHETRRAIRRHGERLAHGPTLEPRLSRTAGQPEIRP